MKNLKITILGIGALALMLGLNIRHAVNNYGIMDGKLHTEILAQSNSSGGDGSGSGNDGSGSGNNGGGSGSGGESGGDSRPYCTCTKSCPDGITTIQCRGYTECSCNGAVSGFYYVVCDGVRASC
jgi:hypothetical protein